MMKFDSSMLTWIMAYATHVWTIVYCSSISIFKRNLLSVNTNFCHILHPLTFLGPTRCASLSGEMFPIENVFEQGGNV